MKVSSLGVVGGPAQGGRRPDGFAYPTFVGLVLLSTAMWVWFRSEDSRSSEVAAGPHRWALNFSATRHTTKPFNLKTRRITFRVLAPRTALRQGANQTLGPSAEELHSFVQPAARACAQRSCPPSRRTLQRAAKREAFAALSCLVAGRGPPLPWIFS